MTAGCDVSGTNTDAAPLDGRTVLATTRRPSGTDVTGGIVAAIGAVPPIDHQTLTRERVLTIAAGASSETIQTFETGGRGGREHTGLSTRAAPRACASGSWAISPRRAECRTSFWLTVAPEYLHQSV